jgi:outer membrane protein TolC
MTYDADGIRRGARRKGGLQPILAWVVALVVPAAPVLAQQISPAGDAEGATVPTAPEGPRFSLERALDLQRRGHPLLTAAKASVAAATADTLSAGLWQNPQLDAAGLYGFGKYVTYDPLGVYTLGYTQFLETAGVPGARQRAASLAQAAVALDAETLHRHLALDAELAAVRLVAAAIRQQVLRQSDVEIAYAQRVVSRRAEQGAAPRYDASRIALAQAQSKAAVLSSEADVRVVRGELEVAVGPMAMDLSGLPELDLFAVASPTALEALLTKLDERPDIAAAAARAQAAGAQVDVARKSVRPGLGLRGGFQYGNAINEIDVTVGVVVPLPVNDRGQGSIGAALARTEVATEQLRSLRTTATQRLRAAHAEWQQRYHAYLQYRDTGAAQVVGMVAEAKAGYLGGKLSVLELVDAYTSNRDGRLRLVDLAEASRVAELRLRRLAQAGARPGE